MYASLFIFWHDFVTCFNILFIFDTLFNILIYLLFYLKKLLDVKNTLNKISTCIVKRKYNGYFDISGVRVICKTCTTIINISNRSISGMKIPLTTKKHKITLKEQKHPKCHHIKKLMLDQ